MVSEGFRELMKSMSPFSGRISVIKQLLDNLDVIPENERSIAHLYLTLPPDERSTTREFVQVLSDAQIKPNPPLTRVTNPEPDKDDQQIVPSRPAPKKADKRPRPVHHPPPKSWPDGNLLDSTIYRFAIHHNPQIKYEGMQTAIDALTACMSPEKEWYDFHYEIMAYKPGYGVYVKRVPGQGHRTSAADTDKMEMGFGSLPPNSISQPYKTVPVKPPIIAPQRVRSRNWYWSFCEAIDQDGGNLARYRNAVACWRAEIGDPKTTGFTGWKNRDATHSFIHKGWHIAFGNAMEKEKGMRVIRPRLNK